MICQISHNTNVDQHVGMKVMHLDLPSGVWGTSAQKPKIVFIKSNVMQGFSLKVRFFKTFLQCSLNYQNYERAL